MLVGLLWNHWSFFILFTIIHFGCWWEYLGLIEKIHKIFFHLYIKIGLMLIGYGLMLLFCNKAYQINGYVLKENFSLSVSAAGFTLLIIGLFQKTTLTFKSIGSAALGLLYISLCWGLMISLRQIGMAFKGDTLFFDFGRAIPCFIIFSIWINDTMAYMVGSLIGKRPLSKISPKKTWEGTLGGIILAILISLIYSNFKTEVIWIVMITLIASISGTLGDLFQSKLKRMADVKDSGSFMPGHGGFLDRFDSLLFAVPAVWVYLYFFL
jgi:phosphatidate cytidylyltransferase